MAKTCLCDGFCLRKNSIHVSLFYNLTKSKFTFFDSKNFSENGNFLFISIFSISSFLVLFFDNAIKVPVKKNRINFLYGSLFFMFHQLSKQLPFQGQQ